MGDSGFSSAAEAVLERRAELNTNELPVTYEQIWNETHRKVCFGWIRQNGYKAICLQFPDEYLSFSNAISDNLKSNFTGENIKVFVMADTTYGSCCVDEIAAAHVDGDCVIHFGNACRSRATRLAVLYLYPEFTLDLESMLTKLSALRSTCTDKIVCLYLDIGYHHVLEQQKDVDMEIVGETLHTKLREVLCPKDLHVQIYPADESMATDFETNENMICIFVGADNQRFANLSLTTKAAQWHIYNPVDDHLTEKNPLTANFIRKRYYYIEKCKDARTLGLIVATLTANGYLDVIARLQDMAKSHGIRTQIISVGRINPAKLANFLEIDCFVLIGCPFNNMYTSKDYYKPIVSVFEAEMALNPAWHMKYPESYVTDFKQLLPAGRSFLAFESKDVVPQDVSLINGNLRDNTAETLEPETASTSAVATQAKMALMTTPNGLTFEDRTWQGLDPALGLNEPAKLQKGLSGIPINYTHE